MNVPDPRHPPSAAATEAARRVQAENALIETFTRLAAHGDRERDSFRPSPVMERLALQVLGCWQLMVAEVSWTRFELAGIDGAWDRGAGIPRELALIAKQIGVRWPHEEISAAIDHAAKIRHKVAHMLYIVSIDGTTPHQEMTIARLGDGTGQRRSSTGAPAELAWRDERWTEQQRHHDTITEQQMRHALADIEWVWQSVCSLGRVRQLIAMTAHEPDEFTVDLARWVVPFVQPSWFSDPSNPTLGDLRTPTKPSTPDEASSSS